MIGQPVAKLDVERGMKAPVPCVRIGEPGGLPGRRVAHSVVAERLLPGIRRANLELQPVDDEPRDRDLEIEILKRDLESGVRALERDESARFDVPEIRVDPATDARQVAELAYADADVARATDDRNDVELAAIAVRAGGLRRRRGLIVRVERVGGVGGAVDADGRSESTGQGDRRATGPSRSSRLLHVHRHHRDSSLTRHAKQDEEKRPRPWEKPKPARGPPRGCTALRSRSSVVARRVRFPALLSCLVPLADYQIRGHAWVGAAPHRASRKAGLAPHLPKRVPRRWGTKASRWRGRAPRTRPQLLANGVSGRLACGTRQRADGRPGPANDARTAGLASAGQRVSGATGDALVR